jgi:succinate dehydrogenase hydrophobic anchor subunit
LQETDGWCDAGSENAFCVRRKMKNRRHSLIRAAAYVVSGLLFIFYVSMLICSMNPQTSEDYKMRYLDEGYFWEEQEP